MENVTAGKVELGLSLLLEQTARSIYDKKGPTEIHPGQWAALRYFARANRSSRTVSGLAKFLDVTPGPASRAVKSLLKNNFITSEFNKKDGRSPIFSLSTEGKAILSEDPIKRLARAISTLDSTKKTCLAESLQHLYATLGEGESPHS